MLFGMTTRTIGNAGENTAVRYLEDAGWKILDRNYHCRFGELDIVASPAGCWGDGLADCVVFVEVKFRSTTAFGSGIEAVTQAKLQKLRTAAFVWLGEKREQLGMDPARKREIRFDAIDVGPDGVREHVEGLV